MPSRSKKSTGTVVVRPITPGSHKATKSVLGTLSELNHHAPFEQLLPTPHDVLGFQDRPEWKWKVQPDPWKPWKRSSKSQQCRYECCKHTSRRNPGRGDGRTWVSRQFVCGPALGPEWDDGVWDDSAADADADAEWAREDVGEAEDSRRRERQEVQIMDIARPMKPRGVAKEFEMVDTVQRVIALEDDVQDWESWIDESEMEEWERLEAEDSGGMLAGSYAAVLRENTG